MNPKLTVKMTNRIFVPLLALCFTLPCAAQEEALPSAAATPAPEGLPLTTLSAFIGYLSYDSVLTAMPDYALVQASQEELRQAYEAELKRAEDDFNQKYEAFLEGRRDYPRTILLKRQNELQQLLENNVAFKRQGKKELEAAYAEALAPLRLKLDQAIAAVAQKMGLALVVNTDSEACPFISPTMGVDVSEAVAAEISSISTIRP